MKTITRRIVPLLAAALLATGLSGLGAPASAKPKVNFWLTVLHNNDAESALLAEGDFGGVARFKSLIDRLKATALARPAQGGISGTGRRGVVMISSGDNFLAGPEFNASLEKGPPFYDAIAMDLIGYDAVVLGNHDFDFGPDVLADFIESFESPVPFISANLDVSEEPRLDALEDADRIADSVVIRERGRRIGIVGATTPFLPFISSPRNVEVDPDVAGVVQDEVNRLRNRGVKIIILASHLQSIQEDLALAEELRGIDVMIAGGGDELLADQEDLLIPGDEALVFGSYPQTATLETGRPVPVITTSGAYRYGGRLVAGFNNRGKLVEINQGASGPLRVSGVPPDAVPADPEVQARVVDPVEASVAALAANVIGSSQVDLDGLRSNVRTVETNEGNLIADALLSEGTRLAPAFGVDPPDIGIQNGGGIRNDSIIPAGPITELDTFDMLPFANFVSIVPGIPPAQLKEILENAVSRVEFVDGRFAQVAGFRFSWRPAGTPQVLDLAGNVVTPGTRVVDVTLDDGTQIVDDGAVVQGAPAVDIATIDFSARGGDQYPFRGAPFTTLGITYQQALRNYIETTLGGLITSAEYPTGGEGRITRV